MVSRNGSSEHNVLAMVLIWTLLVLVLPALLAQRRLGDALR